MGSPDTRLASLGAGVPLQTVTARRARGMRYPPFWRRSLRLGGAGHGAQIRIIYALMRVPGRLNRHSVTPRSGWVASGNSPALTWPISARPRCDFSRLKHFQYSAKCVGSVLHYSVHFKRLSQFDKRIRIVNTLGNHGAGVYYTTTSHKAARIKYRVTAHLNSISQDRTKLSEAGIYQILLDVQLNSIVNTAKYTKITYLGSRA